MDNSEDRVRRLGVAGSQSPTTRQRRPRGVPEPHAGAPTPWGIVDGWVRDAKIRRDALIGLAIVLIALVLIACAITGALGAIAHTAMSNPVAQVIAGTVGTGSLGYGGLRLYRRRRTRAAAPGPDA